MYMCTMTDIVRDDLPVAHGILTQNVELCAHKPFASHKCRRSPAGSRGGSEVAVAIAPCNRRCFRNTDHLTKRPPLQLPEAQVVTEGLMLFRHLGEKCCSHLLAPRLRCGNVAGQADLGQRPPQALHGPLLWAAVAAAASGRTLCRPAPKHGAVLKSAAGRAHGRPAPGPAAPVEARDIEARRREERAVDRARHRHHPQDAIRRRCRNAAGAAQVARV
mmetsp:Transcript_124369/g.398292  ORF Transcript_124369/g.398292 Transcript_124369/m.398292 type:complete len:218 (-) Transcript_124369:95-748(-)